MGFRVLVVEDDAQIVADFVTRGLREEGFTVAHAADGNAARRALRVARFDVVVLDWWLPGPDGLAVLQRFRDDGGDAAVLFLTARDAVSDRVRGLYAGADDYLCKPFAFDELLARVRALARRRDGRGGPVLSAHGVRLELATHRAERDGRPLGLKAKEEALLAFFLRHPGEALSRTRIYEAVWDDRFDGVSNTLEVHVHALRQKLEAHGPRLIHTLRGRGYRFGDAPEDAP